LKGLSSIFTGIVIEKGIVASIVQTGQFVKIAVKAPKSVRRAEIGSSIAVNGVCLTVTKIEKDVFVADVMPETVKRSNIALLNSGSIVNLEPALRLGDEVGGHLVTGHIDGIGKIKSVKQDGNAIWYEIEANDSILNQIVKKGSVALDGVSLTVADVDDSIFSVSVIPFTAHETIIGDKKNGDKINIETDIIGKYVEKFVLGNRSNKKSGISFSMLAEHGFL